MKTFTLVIDKVGRYGGEANRRGVIEVTIDVERIAKQLAHRAFFNKGKQSRAMSGAIVGKAHSIEEIA